MDQFKTGFGRRDRGRRFRSERRLRRHGRGRVRGNVSHGDGVYKSVDAGKTWKHVGLQDTRSHRHGSCPSEESRHRLRRGAGTPLGAQRRSRRLPHHRRRQDLEAGAVSQRQSRRRRSRDGSQNPRVLYAAIWEVQPQALDAWTAAARAAASSNRPMAATPGLKFTRNPGLPRGMIGTIGITVSPANPDRVWAHCRSGRRRRVSIRQRRPQLDEDERAEKPATARLVLHAHLSPTRRMPTRSTS